MIFKAITNCTDDFEVCAKFFGFINLSISFPKFKSIFNVKNVRNEIVPYPVLFPQEFCAFCSYIKNASYYPFRGSTC